MVSEQKRGVPQRIRKLRKRRKAAQLRAEQAQTQEQNERQYRRGDCDWKRCSEEAS